MPLEQDGDDPAPVDADLFPSRLSHVKMLEGRVTPATIIARKSKVWRAKVGRSDGHGHSLPAPLCVCIVVTYDFVALSTRGTVIEQSSAQSSCSSSIPSRIQIPISTCSSCKPKHKWEIVYQQSQTNYQPAKPTRYCPCPRGFKVGHPRLTRDGAYPPPGQPKSKRREIRDKSDVQGDLPDYLCIQRTTFF